MDMCSYCRKWHVNVCDEYIQAVLDGKVPLADDPQTSEENPPSEDRKLR